MPSVEIDRSALVRNWRRVAARQPNARTGAAVKCDGYGLGAAEVARALHEAGCRDFFVAWPEEGGIVRQAIEALSDTPESRIYVLQGIEPDAIELFRQERLIPVLSSRDDIAIWTEGASRPGDRPIAALQVETGMNRLGIDDQDLDFVAALVASGDLKTGLLLSHLASADESREQTGSQFRRFNEIAERFPDVERSLANSAGVFCGPEFGFELTRPGIALYGGRGSLPDDCGIEPVATLTAAVLQIRTAKAGEAVGYGGTVRLSRPTRIATIGMGYGDGYRRALSGDHAATRPDLPTPSAFLHGHRVPILGRISMDLVLLDVSDLPEGRVQPGDRAEFFGPNVPIDEVARAAGTIAYEMLTGLGPRVYRRWSQGTN
ncbi:alanine racemase [Fulvimarina endophytica]|nr:alanine racemase [Fulvimarina endophytica]